MPSAFDLQTLRDQRDALQQQYDGLTLTIAEAEEVQTGLQEQIDDVNSVIAFLESGEPAPTALAVIGGITPSTETSGAISSVTLSWAAVTNADTYVWLRSLTPDYLSSVEVYNGPGLTFEDPDLQPDVTYFYRGVARGEGYSDSPLVELTVTTRTQLDEVTDLQLASADGTSVTGTFTKSTNAESFKIYRLIGAGDFEDTDLILTVYEGAFIDTDITPDLDVVNYWVVASAMLYLDSEPVNESIDINDL